MIYENFVETEKNISRDLREFFNLLSPRTRIQLSL